MSKKDYNKIEVKDNMNVENLEGNNTEEMAPMKDKKTPLAKVVDVQPKKVKQNLATRLINGIIGPEGLPGIGSYVNDEIIKPAIKNIIFDAITSAASMAMFGDKAGRGRTNYSSGRGTSGTYNRPSTNYSNRYNTSQPQTQQSRHSQPPERVSVPNKGGLQDYIIEDRFDAAHVLTSLTEHADRYDSVSIADYYDLIGVPSVYTDNTYGWTIDSITRASIVPVRGGYIIKFPPVEVV